MAHARVAPKSVLTAHTPTGAALGSPHPPGAEYIGCPKKVAQLPRRNGPQYSFNRRQGIRGPLA